MGREGGGGKGRGPKYTLLSEFTKLASPLSLYLKFSCQMSLFVFFGGLVQRPAHSSLSSFQTASRLCNLHFVLCRRGVHRIHEMRCLFVVVGLNALLKVLPHWVINPHANPPSDIILTPGALVMLCGNGFLLHAQYHASRDHYHVLSLWYDIGPAPTGNQTHKTSWLLRGYLRPGNSIRSTHPRPPRVKIGG